MRTIRRLHLVTILTLLFMGVSSMTMAGTADSEKMQLTRLSNGMTVLILPDKRFPLVSLRLYVHAGSAYETPKEAGLSHFLEHMVFKGTEKRTKGDIAGDIEKVGGYINAATSFDYTVYVVDVPARSWSDGLDVIKDMAFHSKFEPTEIESEKDVVISELEQREDAPQSRIFTLLQGLAFEGTPYARPIIGSKESIRSFTNADFKNYISHYYQPQSMMLLIAGDIEPEKALAEAEKLFGEYKNTRSIAAVSPISLEELMARKAANNKTTSPIVVEKRPVQKVYLGIALPAAGSTSSMAMSYDVLGHLLGGDATSLFYHKYKYELQLVDDISVGNYDFERTGMLYFSVVLPENKLEEFWKLFMADMVSIAEWADGTSKTEPFATTELDRAKLNIEDGLFRAKETLSGLASKEGSFFFLTGNPRAEEQYLASLKKLSLADIRKAAKTIFVPDNVYAAVIVPEKATVPNLESLFTKAWAKIPRFKAKTERATAQKGTREVIDLGQGRTLVLMPDNTLPYVALDMVFKGGNTLLSPDQQGLAALTASTLTTGTARKNATEMEVYLTSRAASLSAGAGSRIFTVGMRYPERFSKDMVALFRETLEQPAFSLDEISREKRNQTAAIALREDQPLSLAFRRLTPFLFPNQPYGYYQLGMPDTIAGFTQKDITQFWRKQSAMPWVLSVCGAFDREDILKLAQSLPVPSLTPPAPMNPKWTDERELTLKLPGRNQEHLLLVFPTVGGASPEAPAFDLMEAILSGMSGILFTNLRDEKGLGYTVTAMKWQTELTGFLAFYIGTEPAKAKESLEGFTAVIEELQDKLLPKEELTKAIQQLEGEYYRNHQSLGSRSSEAATLLALGYPITYNQDVIKKVKTLTPEDLKKLAVTYLKKDRAYLIRVMP